MQGYEAGAVDYITKPFPIGSFAMKNQSHIPSVVTYKPAKDILRMVNILDFLRNNLQV